MDPNIDPRNWPEPNPWHTNFEEPGIEEFIEVDHTRTGPPRGHRLKDDLERTLYQADVIRLAAAGHSKSEIARRLGMDRKTVRKYIDSALKKTLNSNGAADVRAMELLRMEIIMTRLWPDIERVGRLEETVPDPDSDPTKAPPRPNYDAIDMFLKISKARRELTGADAAKKLDIQADTRVHTSSAADALGHKLDRFMTLADRMMEKGLGSGRTEIDITDEARLAGVRTRALVVGGGSTDDPAGRDPAVVEAEIVEEDEDVDSSGLVDQAPGTWVDGRWVPDES